MEINLCKLFLHKWDYNKDKTIRTCKKCGIRQEFIDFGTSGWTQGEWFVIPEKK